MHRRQNFFELFMVKLHLMRFFFEILLIFSKNSSKITHIKSLRLKKLAPLMAETTKVMISCQKDAPPLKSYN